MKSRGHPLKCFRRCALAMGLISVLMASTFISYELEKPHSISGTSEYDSHKLPWKETDSPFLSTFFKGPSAKDITDLERVDLMDASAALKISKLHRLFSEYHTGLSVRQEEQLARLIYQESVSHQYDPELILAIILTESSFYNWSTSHKGAVGLMQILPKTGKVLVESSDLAVNTSGSLFDPHLNIKCGVQYLTYLHHRFGNLQLALTAYNYGPTRVSQWLSQDQPIPTRYTRKVLTHYQKMLDEQGKGLLPATPSENRS